MDARTPHEPREPNLHALPTPTLVREVMREVEELVKAHIALVRAELRADLRAEARMATGLGAGAIAGLLTLNMLCVTVVLALAGVMRGWLAGLIVSGVLLGIAAVAGGVGWQARVRRPLARTRHELEEDKNLMKEHKE